MPDFMIYALAAGLCLTLMTGPMGSMVVWRRMAYFGETLAHAALLGFGLALLFSLPTTLGVILASVIIAILLSILSRSSNLSSDTILGILSHGSLAIGLVLLSLLPGVTVDLESILFGDVLAVTSKELVLIGLVMLIVMPLLFINWQSFIAICVQEQLAEVEGRPVKLLNNLFMIMMALVIAVGMKVVGVILVTALLIIPAATSRRIARSPEQMALYAVAAGMLAVVGGILMSLQWDTPAGPSIVTVCASLFAVSMLLPQKT
jgi:zinc transport system permease protein|tara:strand:- start:37562 stop:38347 length:786 start_codon:yes stop_codon:yes gene_type:complete